MLVAPLAAFVVGVCMLQWQAALPAWPVLLAGAAVGVALIFASIRTEICARGATVLMLGAVAAAWLWRSRVTPVGALALAASAVCIADPWAVTAAGFWLSFGAFAAIVWVVHGRPAQPAHAVSMGALRTAARVQVAVTLALVPATVLLFQQVSLVAPLANAIAIPLVSWVVTPLALLGASAAALSDPLSALAAAILGIANSVFAAVAAILSGMSAPQWAAVAVPAPPFPLVALAVGGVAWLLAPPGWPARALGIVAILPLFVWPAEQPGAGALWVTALDVGQGSAVVLETRDQAWLYDAGPRYSQDSDAGERVVLPFLHSRGIEAVDGVVVSHLDLDHSGGAAAVLRGIPVRRLLSSVPAGHSALGGTDAQPCIAGQQFGEGELRLRVLHPTTEDYARRLSTNAMSCVVEARVGTVSVLLTGDIPAREEAVLIKREHGLRATWLMVPHHGSGSSSSAGFLDAVRPVVATAQAGYRNLFGHPDPAVVARYAARGVDLLRTDHAGAAQWRFGAGGGEQPRAWRAIAVRYWHNRPGAGHSALPLESDEEVAGEGEPREPLFGMP